MVDVEIIKDWLKKADEDLQFAVLNLKDQKPFYAQICFHFHQAAEKYLKAYIVAIRHFPITPQPLFLKRTIHFLIRQRWLLCCSTCPSSVGLLYPANLI